MTTTVESNLFVFAHLERGRCRECRRGKMEVQNTADIDVGSRRLNLSCSEEWMVGGVQKAQEDLEAV